MKNKIISIALIVTTTTGFSQKIRPYTQAEITRWTSLACSLSKAIPKSFKDHSAKGQDCTSFEWAEMDWRDKKNPKPLTVTDSKNQAIGNYPYYSIEFTKSEDSLQAAENRYLLLIKDAMKPDGSMDPVKLTVAATVESKNAASKTLSVNVSANRVTDFSKQYYAGTKPEKIDIPGELFAYLYLFPAGKQALDENGESVQGTDGAAFYKDKALVILATKAPGSKTEPIAGKQNWKQDRIMPMDKASECILLPIKNICVEISGDEQDVRDMVKQIDWKALQSLIGK